MVGTIVLLTGVLVPVLNGVRQSGQRARCLANLHQIGVGALAYALDNQRMLPTYYCSNAVGFDTFWMRSGDGLVNLGLLAEYVQNPQTFYCPTQDEGSSPSISFEVQRSKWSPEAIDSGPALVDARNVLLPQMGANSSYAARSRQFQPWLLPRWSMLNYTNKVIYSDFIGVDNWQSLDRFSGTLRAPHDSKGYSRLFGDGSASWVSSRKINRNRTVTANAPTAKELQRYYELLDVIP